MRAPRFDAPEGARRFLLAVTPEEGPPRLAAADLAHALRVLRLGPGDHLTGLDGRGAAWPLVVRAATRRELELEVAGAPRREPAPGSAGAPLPWLELHAPLPKGGRAEDLFDALTQLGLARWVPLVTARTAPHARELSAGRRERLERAAAEAAKQCGRLWLPELAPLADLEVVCALATPRYLLSPTAEGALSAALDAHPAGAPLALVAGPEGGLEPEEERRLVDAGARPVRLAPHVLRIETACVAALAVAVEGLAAR